MRSVSKKHAFIFCMRSVSVTLKTTLDFEYMCCQRDIAKKKYLWSLEFVLRSEMRECVRENHFACQVCVCVCACVCFQYCCHVITQYYLLVLWILCMLFLLRDPRGCAWEALVDLVWSSWLHFLEEMHASIGIQTAVLCLIISYFMDTVTIAWWEITIRWIACFGV